MHLLIASLPVLCAGICSAVSSFMRDYGLLLLFFLSFARPRKLAGQNCRAEIKMSLAMRCLNLFSFPFPLFLHPFSPARALLLLASPANMFGRAAGTSNSRPSLHLLSIFPSYSFDLIEVLFPHSISCFPGPLFFRFEDLFPLSQVPLLPWSFCFQHCNSPFPPHRFGFFDGGVRLPK